MRREPGDGTAGRGTASLVGTVKGLVTLCRGEDGLWRAAEWSSLLLGVREPAGAEAGKE